MSSLEKKRRTVDPTVAKARARVAGMSRTRPGDDPELIAEKAKLRDARVDAYVARLVAEAPPLTDAQKAALAGLLAPVDHRGGAAA